MVMARPMATTTAMAAAMAMTGPVFFMIYRS
jgi:hypothetical protein